MIENRNAATALVNAAANNAALNARVFQNGSAALSFMVAFSDRATRGAWQPRMGTAGRAAYTSTAARLWVLQRGFGSVLRDLGSTLGKKRGQTFT